MWLDTDDENEAGAKGAFNMDDFNMAGMGGMGGPGGLDLDQDYGNFDEEGNSFMRIPKLLQNLTRSRMMKKYVMITK